MAHLPARRSRGISPAAARARRPARSRLALHAALALSAAALALPLHAASAPSPSAPAASAPAVPLPAAPLPAAPLLAAPILAQAAAGAGAGARSFRIPAGSLAGSLPRFADSAGITVLFDPALVGARRAPALEGRYTVTQGFARLLEGSGLAVQRRGGGVYVLRPAPEPGVTELAPVQVEGEESPEPAAWQTSTDRERLDALQIRGWSDLGRRAEPGVNFNRQSGSINIRGLDQDRVLTRVDGVRLPWLDDGARGVKGGLEAVDFDMLSRLDILRGADAMAGGSGATGGLADLHTLDPSDLLLDGQAFGALAKADYDSADTSRGINAALAGQLRDHTFWLLQAGARRGHELGNRADAGGLGPRRSEPTPAGYDQTSVLLKLQQRLEGGHRLGLTGETFRRRERLDNLFQQGPGTSYLAGANTGNKKNRRERVSFDYDYRAPSAGGLLDTAHAVVYWQRTTLDSGLDGVRSVDRRAYAIPGDPFYYRYPSGPFGRGNSIRQTLYGVDAEASRRLGSGSFRQTLSAGGEWFGNKTEQHSGGYDNCPALPPGLPARLGPRLCDMLHTNQADMPESRGSQWALWAQDEFGFAEGRYTLAPALRYDHFEQKPRATAGYASNPNAGPLPPSNSGGRFSPRLLATWRAREALSFYAQYAYGFKAPTATELYTNYGGPGTYLRVGNPYLKPETSRGWELGANMGSGSLGGAVSFFDNRYQDFIDKGVSLDAGSPLWQPGWEDLYPNGVTGAVNRARVRIYGAEASGHWRFAPGWRTWGSVAWAVGKDQDTGRHLNSVAPLKAILGLGYARDAWGVDATLTTALRRGKVQYPDAAAKAPNADFKAPGYGVVDLSGYWQPAPVRGLQVRAGVFNLFDRKYWEALNVPTAGPMALPRPVDWYTEPGRSVRVSLSYRY